MNEIAKAKHRLACAGFDFPSVPESLASRFKERGPWVYSTKPLHLSPYCFREYVAEGASSRARDYMLVAHAGHGVNSYALHYYLVKQPLRLFLQVAYGGIYTDNDRAVRRANHCFALVASLRAAIDKAIAMERISPMHTLLVASSEFYGSYWVNGADKHEVDPNLPSTDASEFILMAVLESIDHGCS